ncbi:putative endonuclease [Rhizorhabdus histidinilytica]|jgi:putative endonuclease|uniref:Putative endonuclease n=1 Tax=Rhizorhabdus histidinilytica TaxID=439228 RepID=A0A1T4ZR80_9SPHN|nr:putative endonuclease [Rhizorhabdus histidinilytica]
MSVFPHDGLHERRLRLHHEQCVSGTLYVGVTADLAARIYQHRIGEGSTFCREHGLTRLVYAEQHERIDAAIAREKMLKAWKRAWKINLIEKANPGWRDLYEEIIA